MNRDLEEANIVYNDTESMRRADAHIIEAAATLRTKVPPQEILESEGAVGSRVRVSCKVEAELRGSSHLAGLCHHVITLSDHMVVTCCDEVLAVGGTEGHRVV